MQLFQNGFVFCRRRAVGPVGAATAVLLILFLSSCAKKGAPVAGPAGPIEVSVRWEDRHSILEVEDTGSGYV